MSKHVVENEKRHFESLGGDMNSPWNQGYVSALANYRIITEAEFDELMIWMNHDFEEVSQAINDTVAIVKQTIPLHIRVFRKILDFLSPFKY